MRLASGRVVTARHILIATGARPDYPLAIPGIEQAISSNEIFDLERFPQRLLVAGGGYIGVEFASLFARLGAEVTLIARASNILRGFDEDMRDGLRDAMGHAGVRFRFGCLPTRVETRSGALEVTLSDGETIVVDQFLNAVGRRPNTKDLGLESAGVAIDALGAVKVDAFSQGSVETVHAIGDVTNRLNLTPVAIREGHAFADTIFGGKKTAMDHRNVPSAVFTTPEIGAVGLTETQARAAHRVVEVYRASFHADEGDIVRPERTDDHEDRRRRRERPRPRRPYSRPRSRRNGAAFGHRRQDGRDQGRFRRHRGAASDSVGRASDDAQTHGPL